MNYVSKWLLKCVAVLSLQVVQLDSDCDPLRLMQFSYSQDDFAVLCADLNVHLAEITTNHQVKLHPLKLGTDTPGVFVESNSELVSLSYIGQKVVEKYSYHTAQTETVDLPEELFCLEGSNATLLPLNTQERFLLQCTTQYGPTIYIVSFDLTEKPRGIELYGKPYASTDGSYVSMVNGSRVVSYTTANQSAQPSIENFASRVTHLEFLSPSSALVFTENRGHYVMTLSPGQSKQRLLPGGLPVVWVWVSPSNHYLYVTENREIYLVNETSTKPEVAPKILVSSLELLLFVPKYVPPTMTPTEISFSTNKTVLDLSGSTSTNRLPAILGGIFGGIVCVVAGITLVGLIIAGVKIYNHSHSKLLTSVDASTPHEKNFSPHRAKEAEEEDQNGDRQRLLASPHRPDQNGAISTDQNGAISTDQNGATTTDLNGATTTASTPPRVTTVSSDPNSNKLGEVTERDAQPIATISKQIVSPPLIPKHIEIHAGKTAAAPPVNISTTPPQATATQPAVHNAATNTAADTTTTQTTAPSLEQREYDVMPFHGIVSCPRNTSTAQSAFGEAEEEHTYPLHAGIVAS